MYRLETQYTNNRIMLTGELGSSGPDTLISIPEKRRYAGLHLGLHPKSDLTDKQYLILFKVDNRSYYDSYWEIYHNGTLEDSFTINRTDNAFAILVECDGEDSTYLYFKLANKSYVWFEAIEVELL